MSEIERQPGDVARSRRTDGQPSKRDTNDHDDLYQVVYEESQRTLDSQKDELNTIRDRTVQFAIFIGAATAFLVGSGLQSPHRDPAFYLMAGLASAVSLASIGLLFWILNPNTKKLWITGVAADKLITDWIEKEVPRPSKAQFVKDLAIMNADTQHENEGLLAALRTRYRYLIAVGALQVIVWAALVWWKG